MQQLRRNVPTVNDLYLFVRVDVDDERCDEPFVVAGLCGVGVVPYDRGVEGVDEGGQGGLSVGRRPEGADDGERGADRGQALALDIADQNPGTPRRDDDVVDVAANEPVLLDGLVHAVDQDVVGE